MAKELLVKGTRKAMAERQGSGLARAHVPKLKVTRLRVSILLRSAPVSICRQEIASVEGTKLNVN